MDQEKIGKLIKEIRKKHHLTQNDFASKYGVTYQAVSKWENGKNIPDISILKQIANDFDIDIDSLLEGESKKKKNNHVLIILIVMILIILISFFSYMIFHKDNFEFKTMKTSCDNFNISGSLSYNQKKSSIYISNIEYCGKEKDISYQKINCALYEKNQNIVKKISDCEAQKNQNITLDNYLKNIEFIVDDYEASCKKFEGNELYVQIEAQLNEEKVVTYRIPISFNQCQN